MRLTFLRGPLTVIAITIGFSAWAIHANAEETGVFSGRVHVDIPAYGTETFPVDIDSAWRFETAMRMLVLRHAAILPAREEYLATQQALFDAEEALEEPQATVDALKATLESLRASAEADEAAATALEPVIAERETELVAAEAILAPLVLAKADAFTAFTAAKDAYDKATEAYNLALQKQAEAVRTPMVQMATVLTMMNLELAETGAQLRILTDAVCSGHNYPHEHLSEYVEACPDILTAEQD